MTFLGPGISNQECILWLRRETNSRGGGFINILTASCPLFSLMRVLCLKIIPSKLKRIIEFLETWTDLGKQVPINSYYNILIDWWTKINNTTSLRRNDSSNDDLFSCWISMTQLVGLPKHARVELYRISHLTNSFILQQSLGCNGRPWKMTDFWKTALYLLWRNPGIMWQFELFGRWGFQNGQLFSLYSWYATVWNIGAFRWINQIIYKYFNMIRIKQIMDPL